MTYEQAKKLKNKLVRDFIFLEKPVSKNYCFIHDRTYKPFDALKSDIFEHVNGAAIVKTRQSYAVKVYTEGSVPQKDLAAYFGIDVNDFIIDNIGPITILSWPSPGGRICYPKGTVGTVGSYVTDSSEKKYLLSNTHVLTNFCKGGVGDPIVHPGTVNLGTNIIAHVTQFIPVQFQGPDNFLDCGIAELMNPNGHRANQLPGTGVIKGVINATEGLAVMKNGSATGVTRGYVSDPQDASIKVDYGPDYLRNRVAFFEDQIEIKGFAERPHFADVGDSGSLLVNSEGDRAVGLVFAGGIEGTTFANPISKVLQALNVRFM